jgi:hypothetical protein
VNQIRRYTIPDSRLPFVNAEVERTTFQGQPHLVSSIWGGAVGGRIYFWNPDTGSKGMRHLPDGVPGAYMLRTAGDGCLYLGCGNGDLIRYDSTTDTFETLVTGELKSIPGEAVSRTGTPSGPLRRGTWGSTTGARTVS